MKIIFCLLVVGVASVLGLDWDHLSIKWVDELVDPEHTNSFWGIPKTAEEARAEGYVKVDLKHDLGAHTYCLKNDPRICPLYHPQGYIVGFQVGQVLSDLAEVPLSVYNMRAQPSTQMKWMFGQEVYTSTCYTVDPEIIAQSNYSRTDGLLGTDGVWFKMTDGYLYVPRAMEDIASEWIKSPCQDQQGIHHFYKSRPEMSCQEWLPWFVIHDQNELNSVGYFAPGRTSTYKRSWYEDFDANNTKPLIPTSPDCLEQAFFDYGSIALHIFFNSEPWLASCSE